MILIKASWELGSRRWELWVGEPLSSHERCFEKREVSLAVVNTLTKSNLKKK